MAKKTGGRENVRVRTPQLPDSFPPETCQRLRNLAMDRNKAITDKARLIVARDEIEDRIAKLGGDEEKKRERLKAEHYDAVHAITAAHNMKAWAEDKIIETIENGDQLHLIKDPGWIDPEPPEPGEDDEDEETPRLGKAPTPPTPASADPGKVPHWSTAFRLLFREEAADLPQPTKAYIRDLGKSGVDSPSVFLAAIALNAKENAPLLRNLEPADAAAKVLRAIECRRKADDVAGAPLPAAWSEQLEKFNGTLGRERLAGLGELVGQAEAPAP